MKEGYVERKIHMCIELVENATSDAQRKIYQGYLEFWQDKHKNQIISIEKPPEEKPPEEDEIEAIIEDLTEAQKIEEFELKNFPKKAYYNRNGTTNKTKAFQDFLNQSE